jgi:hypothetical protein
MEKQLKKLMRSLKLVHTELLFLLKFEEIKYMVATAVVFEMLRISVIIFWA